MSSRSNEQGFTLLEVLIAIVIFAGGVVLVIEGMGRSQQAFAIAQNLIRAVEIGESKIMESKLSLFQDHKLSSGLTRGDEKWLGREFEWTKETRPHRDLKLKDTTKLNKVDVAVTWREGQRHNDLLFSALFLNREKKENLQSS